VSCHFMATAVQRQFVLRTGTWYVERVVLMILAVKFDKVHGQEVLRSRSRIIMVDPK
jgi:hypothetical protein